MSLHYQIWSQGRGNTRASLQSDDQPVIFPYLFHMRARDKRQRTAFLCVGAYSHIMMTTKKFDSLIIHNFYALASREPHTVREPLLTRQPYEFCVEPP